MRNCLLDEYIHILYLHHAGRLLILLNHKKVSQIRWNSLLNEKGIYHNIQSKKLAVNVENNIDLDYLLPLSSALIQKKSALFLWVTTHTDNILQIFQEKEFYDSIPSSEFAFPDAQPGV